VIRALLDTNVLISAVIGTGLPRDIVVAGRTGRFRAVSSPYVVEEFRRVTVGKFEFDAPEVDRIAYAIARSCDVVPVFDSSTRWCSDRADDAVIETAMQGRASFIVTGDRHLLRCEVGALEFVTPAQFAQILAAQADGVSTE